MLELPNDVIVVVRGTEVLIEQRGEAFALCSRAAAAPFAGASIFLGLLGERACYAAPARVEISELPQGLVFSAARPLFSALAEAELGMVGRALACVEFEETHRFCGRCGSLTEALLPAGFARPRAGERARACPNCQLTAHPRIPPAVIILVENGDRILLARGANFPPGMFSAVAGFVEIGESLEDTAHREVAEEVGVRIDNLRYFSSQPWPFGRSLMVGLYASYAGGELRADGTEIIEADWFRRDQLPALPPKISIARRLIENFLAR
jgi:NAD+ diphosphatase